MKLRAQNQAVVLWLPLKVHADKRTEYAGDSVQPWSLNTPKSWTRTVFSGIEKMQHSLPICHGDQRCGR